MLKRLFDTYNSDLAVVCADKTNRTSADLLVDPEFYLSDNLFLSITLSFPRKRESIFYVSL